MILTQDYILEQLEIDKQYTALEITNNIFNTNQTTTNNSAYQSVRAMMFRLKKYNAVERFWDDKLKRELWNVTIKS